jgi:uncharacterized membrane protein
MTVAAPSAVQPSEPAEKPTGISVGRASALWVLIAGVIGLASALTLTVEKLRILENPDYVPSWVTPQAEAFGFPNPLIGIVSFAIVVVTGVLALARVDLPRWYWVGLATGTLLGTAFVHWLIFQSLYRIGALCPYCMVVWAVTIPLLAVVTAIAVRPTASSNGVVRVLYTWRWSLVVLWFTALILLILLRFWDYWSTLV